MKQNPPSIPRSFMAGLLFGVLMAIPARAGTLLHIKFDEAIADQPIPLVSSDGTIFQSANKSGPVGSSNVPAQSSLKKAALFKKANKDFLSTDASVATLNFRDGQAFVVEGWFLPSSLPTGKEQPHLFSNRSSSANQNIGIAVFLTASEKDKTKADLRFFVDGGPPKKHAIIKATDAIEAGKWYHFIATRGADGKLSLMVNDSDVNDPDAGNFSGALSSDAPSVIGKSTLSYTAAVYFDGILGELKISEPTKETK